MAYVRLLKQNKNLRAIPNKLTSTVVGRGVGDGVGSRVATPRQGSTSFHQAMPTESAPLRGTYIVCERNLSKFVVLVVASHAIVLGLKLATLLTSRHFTGT